MRTKIQTSSLVALLLLIFSCSKENTGSSTDSANRNEVSASVSSNAFEQSMDEQVGRTVVGKWILYYDWECTGYPEQDVITVNADGTWSSSQGFTGFWIAGRHMFVFNFKKSETTYSGVMFISQIKGIMGTFQYAQSPQGCFHMAPYTDDIKEMRKAGSRDADGSEK